MLQLADLVLLSKPMAISFSLLTDSCEVRLFFFLIIINPSANIKENPKACKNLKPWNPKLSGKLTQESHLPWEGRTVRLGQQGPPLKLIWMNLTQVGGRPAPDVTPWLNRTQCSWHPHKYVLKSTLERERKKKSHCMFQINKGKW